MKRALVGIALLALAILIYLLNGHGDRPPAYVAPRDAAVATAQPRLQPPPGAALHDDDTAPRAPASTGDDEPPPITQPAMAEAPSYPPGSQPLTEGTDPAIGPDHATAICFAQTSLPLAAGAQTIPLTFFGKILHDKGVDGPYTLRFMMVFEEFPDRGTYWPGATVDDAYTTKPYKAASFSPAPYQPPANTTPEVTAKSPSQANTPPPLYTR